MFIKSYEYYIITSSFKLRLFNTIYSLNNEKINKFITHFKH